MALTKVSGGAGAGGVVSSLARGLATAELTPAEASAFGSSVLSMTIAVMAANVRDVSDPTRRHHARDRSRAIAHLT